MTPDDLRQLADEATPGPWLHEGFYVRPTSRNLPLVDLSAHPPSALHDARLIALAPDLARLCAELGEALEDIANAVIQPTTHKVMDHARVALAKLEALEAR